MPEVSTLEVSTLEIGTLEVSTQEVCFPEVSMPEVGTPEVSTPEISAPEVCMPEVSTFTLTGICFKPKPVLFEDLVEFGLTDSFHVTHVARPQHVRG